MSKTEEREEVLRIIERTVDILRRSGPGVLGERRLRRELRRCRPTIALTAEELQVVVEESEGRLVQLEVAIDGPAERVIDSRVVLMDPEDAPPPGLAGSLWHSLAAMADEVDLRSRPAVTRWNLQAEWAERACHAAGASGRGR